jgi:stage V sporulation protein G
MAVKKVDIIPIKPHDGLLGFASIEFNQFYVGSIGVHKKRDGSGYRITYPTKQIGEQNLPVCHPVQPDLSREIEQAICEKASELFGE